ARAARAGDRGGPRALDDFEPPGQPDFLAPGREVDADHRHRGVAVGADGGTHRLGGIPGALGASATSAADEIERHPLRSTCRRGIPTSLHINYDAASPSPLAGE